MFSLQHENVAFMKTFNFTFTNDTSQICIYLPTNVEYIPVHNIFISSPPVALPTCSYNAFCTKYDELDVGIPHNQYDL